MTHVPVLLKEVIRLLSPRSGEQYIDATADGGGHTVAILDAIQPDGKLLAIERDPELFQILRSRLRKEFPSAGNGYVLHHGSYSNLETIARSVQFGPVAGILFDLGFSSFHIDTSGRGFSFQKNEPLDMRYDTGEGNSAAELLNSWDEEELSKIIGQFGEERFAKRIARAVINTRRSGKPIGTTKDLVETIRDAVPVWYQHSRIHFATRTFQALRIAVNHELECLEKGLAASEALLAPRGRIAIISFHSLEDRIIKTFFRHTDRRKNFSALTRTPLRPSHEEIHINPRARSARLRVFEKLV